MTNINTLNYSRYDLTRVNPFSVVSYDACACHSVVWP